jgi:hypothetical protein
MHARLQRLMKLLAMERIVVSVCMISDEMGRLG